MTMTVPDAAPADRIRQSSFHPGASVPAACPGGKRLDPRHAPPGTLNHLSLKFAVTGA